MKQFLRSLFMLLMLVVWASGSFAQEKTYSYTFGTATKADFTSLNQTKTLNGKSWSLAVTPNNAHINTDTQQNGQQIGSKNSPVKKATYTTSDISGTIKKVSIEAGNASSVSKTNVSVSVNGVSYGSNDLKANSQDLTINNFTGNEAGKIEIVFTNTATKGGYRIKSITITYEEGPSKTPTTLDFGFTTKTANINEPFTATATLKANDTDLAGDITYESSNKDCATVEPTTGKVTPLAIGTTTITAKYAGDDTYAKAEASYIVKVIDPNAIETTFDFTKPENYNYGVSSGKDNHEGDLDDNGGQIISNGVVITSTSGNGTPNRFWEDGLRVYKNSKLVVSASGYKITKITTEGGECTWTYNDNGTAVFENDPNEGSTVKLTSMTVTMSPLPQVAFFENKDNDDALITYDKKTVNTTLTRTLVANKWNTFCVPFETEITGTALEGATVKAVGTIEGNVINLVDATKIEAGVPYLVMPTTGDIVNPTFKSVTITEISAKEVGNDEYKFVGTYSPKPIRDQEFGTIWGVTAQGKLAKINANTTMKGLRAYFVFPTTTAAAKLNFDGETTGINNIETNATVNGKVYNLNGQYVGNSLNGLKKGIYVVNGKKVIK